MKTKLSWFLMIVGLWAWVLILAVGVSFLRASAGARNPCLEPGNLTTNCGFDTFSEHVDGEKTFRIPEGWWYFILAGNVDFRQSDDTYWGAPSLWILSDGVPFTAGVYQQVSVTPGVVYQTDIGWAAVTRPDFERKLGLDPTGGTDPLAPTVIWSRSEWGIESWPDLTVSARAVGPTMTVFVWAHHPTTYGNDWIFLDAVGLWPDPNQPAATVTPTPTPTVPTPTRVPPTRTPVPAPATDTPAAPPATDTPVAVETSTPFPTETSEPVADTPTPLPTLTPTPSPAPPTATPTPTWTPSVTPLPVAQLVATRSAKEPPLLGQTARQAPPVDRILLLIAGGALLFSILLVAIALWLWLRGRRTAHERGDGAYDSGG